MANENGNAPHAPGTTQHAIAPAFSSDFLNRAEIRRQIETVAHVWGNPSISSAPDLDTRSQHYAVWLKRARASHFYPIEFLLPRLEIPVDDTLPEVMKLMDTHCEGNEELIKKLTKLQWGYFFYLGGGASTLDEQAYPDAIKKRIRANTCMRMKMINGTLRKILGDSIAGYTAVEFGTNWGGFSIDLACSGAKKVLGIDVRSDNIAKAKMLAKYVRVQNVEFECADIYDVTQKNSVQFDIVLNLGLMYHITDPYRLIKHTFETCRVCAVVDTITHREPFSGYIQGVPKDLERSEWGIHRVELHPTYRGLIDVMQAVGFRDIIEFSPVFPEDFPDRDANVYYTRHRRCLVGFK